MDHKGEKRNAEIEKISKNLTVGGVEIISCEETKKICLKPELIEATSNKVTKSDEFENYIKTEKKEVELIIIRLKSTGTSGEMIHLESQKLKALYNTAINRFPEELRFWDAYMQFSRKFEYKGEISSSLKSMLNTHADNPEAWMRAISWEYEDMQNTKKAREYFIRAIQKNPESELLFKNYVLFELREGPKAPEGTAEERNLALQRATVVYNMAKNKIKDLKFLVAMLHIVQDYPFADILTENIIRDMEESYARSELLWHTLAQRELMGYHRLIGEIHYPNDYDDHEITPPHLPRKKRLRARIEICVKIYDVATETLNTEQMWHYYIKEMLILNEDLSTLKKLKVRSLMNAFKGAHKADFLTLEHYYDFLKLLMETEQDDVYFRSVFKFATRKYKDATKLWAAWLTYHIRRMDRAGTEKGRHL